MAMVRSISWAMVGALVVAQACSSGNGRTYDQGSAGESNGGSANGGLGNAAGDKSNYGGGANAAGTAGVGALVAGGMVNTAGASNVAGTGAATGGVNSAGANSAGANSAGTSSTAAGASAMGGATGGGFTNGGTSTMGGATSSGGIGTTGGVATGGVATGGVATGGVATGGVATGGATSDTTVPRVMSITPTNAATGIASTATVQITFSEAMNTTSVANALSITNLLPGDLTLTWNSAKTILSVQATAGFAYAEGTSATLAARAFTVALGAGALDLAGNGLSPAFSSSFKTLRRITQTFAPESLRIYSTYGHAIGDSPSTCTDFSGLFRLGVWANPGSGGSWYIFATYNTSSLGTPTTIESAYYRATQGAMLGGDFYASGGTVILDKLAYQSIDNTVLDAPVTSSIGTFCTSGAVVSPSVSILNPFRTDVSAGLQRQLYKLSGPGGTTNLHPQFECTAGFSLQTTYLTP